MREFEGAFADGTVAVRRPVRLLMGTETLSILDLEGVPLETWRLRDLRLAEEVYPGQPARLIHRARRSASVQINDLGAIGELCRRAPHLGSRNLSGWKPLSRLLFWSVTSVVLVTLLILGLPRLADIGARLVPVAWSQSLGRAVVESMPGRTCDGQEGLEVLDALSHRLTSSVSLPYPLQVQVRNSEEINAFAAPGGHVVILSGLLENVESPGEFAAVLAHEIGHVVERHPTRGVIRHAGLGLVVGALVGDVSALAALAADIGTFLALMSYSRSDEEAADEIAVQILNTNDIRGDGFVRFFERLQKEADGEDSEALQLVSTHPGHAQRILYVRSRITGKGDAMTQSEWASLRTICSD